jgi:hypothetical protein
VPFPRVKIINFTGKDEVTCNYQKISLPLKAGEADPKTLSAKQGAKFLNCFRAGITG